MSIDVLDHPPEYSIFLHDYLLPGKPVVIKGLCRDWQIRKTWLAQDGKIDYDYLIAKHGDSQVPVVVQTRDCQDRGEMTLKEFVEHLRENEDAPSCNEERRIYLKDWHCVQENPEDELYATPDIFLDDWMNEQAVNRGMDDYRFVYLGGPNTYTPLHHDVYLSYSWSASITGTKRWVFIPPQFKEALENFNGEMPADIFDPCLSVASHPALEQIRAAAIVVEQNSGETIFVPSGWFHFVRNVTTCLSVNHNWCNATNLTIMYRALVEQVAAGEAAIDDLRDVVPSDEFYDLVQNMTRANWGMAWQEFWTMVRYHMNRPQHATGGYIGDKWIITEQHRPSREWEEGRVAKLMEDWTEYKTNAHARNIILEIA
ncbi:hypothetical protein YB2330_002465 [Saitoella coloradoensis]